MYYDISLIFYIQTVKRQPKRNATKQFSEMAIPSEILDWVVEDNFVLTEKNTDESEKQCENSDINVTTQQTNDSDADHNNGKQDESYKIIHNSLQEDTNQDTTPTEERDGNIVEMQVNFFIFFTGRVPKRGKVMFLHTYVSNFLKLEGGRGVAIY